MCVKLYIVVFIHVVYYTKQNSIRNEFSLCFFFLAYGCSYGGQL